MKLWLLTQDERNGYDTYDSMVVAAGTESEARMVTPPGTTWASLVMPYEVWAASPACVHAEYIGEAAPGMEAGRVICASFHAG